MTAACTTTPIQTWYQTVITSSSSTSFSKSTSTVPAVLTTLTLQSCLQSVDLPIPTCIESTQVLSVSTIKDAQTNTIEVPVTVQVPVTQTTPTHTLFQSCPPNSAPNSPTVPTTQNGSPVTSSVLVLSTPPPSTAVLSSSTTLANGQVSVVSTTVVYTQDPVSVYSPTIAFVQETQGSGSGTPAHLGVIIGGLLGGVLGILFIVAILWWIRKHRNKDNQMFERVAGDDDFGIRAGQRSKRFDIDSDLEPMPYHYGLIGHGGSFPPSFTDHGPIPPVLGFSTATSVPNIAFSESSHSTSRWASTSTGSLAPFLSADEKAASSMTLDDASSSEEKGEMPSSSLHILTSPGDPSEGEEDVAGSPVSFRQLMTLKVVNQRDDE